MTNRAPAPMWLGLGFIAASLLFPARAYDVSAFTYAVVAEEGLSKVHEAAHPLYVPLLRFTARLLERLGFGGPYLFAFQLLSLLAGAALLVALYRALSDWSGDGWASLWAALFLGLQNQFWYFCMQTKPYALSACFSVLALRALGSRRRDWRFGLLAGSLAGLAIGFNAVSAALLPCAWLWLYLKRKEYRLPWLAAFHAGLAALGLAYVALLPDAPWAAASRMQLDSDWPSLLRQRSLPLVLRTFARHLAGGWSDVWWLLPWAPALAAALLARKDPLTRQACAAGAVFCASFGAFFLLFDARNHYTFALLLPVPFALAALARGNLRRRALLAATVAGVGLQSFLGTIRPLSSRGAETARVETDFLARSLTKDDLLIAAGAPDWRIAYFSKGRFRMGRFDTGLDGRLYDPPSVVVAPAVFEALAAELADGRTVWLAADAYFRPDAVLGEARVTDYQQLIQARLLRGFRFGEPRVSPAGQRYLPVLRRGRGRPKTDRVQNGPPTRRGTLPGKSS